MAAELVYLEVALALPCVIFLWTMVGILKRTGWLEVFWLKSFFSVDIFWRVLLISGLIWDKSYPYLLAFGSFKEFIFGIQISV